jgi:tryptophan synthase beta subunit
MPNLIELEDAFEHAINDKSFIDEFDYYLKIMLADLTHYTLLNS